MAPKKTEPPQVAPMPAFIRLPRHKERDPVCGLSRSQLRKIIIELEVRTVSIKVPRSKKAAKELGSDSPSRGCRLIDVSDLIKKIHERAEREEKASEVNA